jgi:hypothetical protein
VFFYLAAGSFSPMNTAVGNSVSPLSEEPILAGLLAYWTARRQASGVGDKRDIDPTEIEPALLPFIGISEIEAETARIRYRLVGTGIAQRHGADPTGKYLDDVLQGAYLDYLIGLHRECCASRRPIYADSLSQRPTGQWIRVKRLLPPLTQGGEAIVFVLLALSYPTPKLGGDDFLGWHASGAELNELAHAVL